jgi:hypothetical protein
MNCLRCLALANKIDFFEPSCTKQANVCPHNSELQETDNRYNQQQKDKPKYLTATNKNVLTLTLRS